VGKIGEKRVSQVITIVETGAKREKVTMGKNEAEIGMVNAYTRNCGQ